MNSEIKLISENESYKYKFSIVMAVYNVGKYISETLDSIISKDIGFCDNVQLILVDDCSKDDSFEICKQYDKQAILELKSEFTNEEISVMIDVLKAHDYLERVTFISFYYEHLQFIRKQLPDQPLQFLTKYYSNRILRMLSEDKIDIAISYKWLTNRVVQKLKNAGIKVNCWTVDDEKTASKFIDMGVDYITTNILE